MNHPVDLGEFKQQAAELYNQRHDTYDASDFYAKLAHRFVEFADIQSGQKILSFLKLMLKRWIFRIIVSTGFYVVAPSL